MMKNNKIFILVAILAATVVAAAGTFALLNFINEKKEGDQPEINVNEPLEETSAKDELAPVIDEQKNSVAQAIDREATDLMESDPVSAKEKFSEAESAYREAGNELKASEMNANAMTAQLLAEQKSQQEN